MCSGLPGLCPQCEVSRWPAGDHPAMNRSTRVGQRWSNARAGVRHYEVSNDPVRQPLLDTRCGPPGRLLSLALSPHAENGGLGCRPTSVWVLGDAVLGLTITDLCSIVILIGRRESGQTAGQRSQHPGPGRRRTPYLCGRPPCSRHWVAARRTPAGRQVQHSPDGMESLLGAIYLQHSMDPVR